MHLRRQATLQPEVGWNRSNVTSRNRSIKSASSCTEAGSPITRVRVHGTTRRALERMRHKLVLESLACPYISKARHGNVWEINAPTQTAEELINEILQEGE
jgi:hypothetical protein